MPQPTVGDYFTLANYVYNNNTGGQPTLAPAGWTAVRNGPVDPNTGLPTGGGQVDPNTGYAATAFRSDADPNVIVVAFAGTQPWGANGTGTADEDIATGANAAANAEALLYVNEIRSENPGAEIYLTGHSLGGEEAQYVIMNADPGSIAGGATFAAPGVPNADPDQGLDNPNWVNYVLSGDVIGNYTPADGDHYGNSVTLDASPFLLEQGVAIIAGELAQQGNVGGAVALLSSDPIAFITAGLEHRMASYGEALGISDVSNDSSAEEDASSLAVQVLLSSDAGQAMIDLMNAGVSADLLGSDAGQMIIDALNDAGSVLNDIENGGGAGIEIDPSNRDDRLPPPDIPPAPTPGRDPLVLDLAGAGINLVGLDTSKAYFDYLDTGYARLTGWTGNGNGILVSDPGASGVITGAQVFGAQSGDGFADLAALDSNGDGVIDASDPGFASLRVWVDANGDGTSTLGELYSLADLGIVSINLAKTQSGDLVDGNTIVSTSSFTVVSGAQTTTHEIAEVTFATNSAYVNYTPPANFSYAADALTLPEVDGWGTLPDLWVAMSQSADLTATVKSLVLNAGSLSAADFDSAFQAMVLQWAGASSIDPTSRGPYVDARHLALVYAYYGIDQVADPNYAIDPNWHNGPTVWEPDYKAIIAALEIRFVSGVAVAAFENGAAASTFKGNPFLSFANVSYDATTDKITADLPQLFASLVKNSSDAADQSAYWQQALQLVADLQYDMPGGNADAGGADLLVAALKAGLDTSLVDQLGAFLNTNFIDATTLAGNISLNADDHFVIMGGADKQFSGSNGTTFYYASSADAGVQTINPSAGENADSLIFDSAVNEANVTLQADGDDLVISDATDGVSITVKGNFFYNWGNHSHVNAITFADGTSWSLAGDNNLTFNYDGSAGNMSLSGSGWAVTNVFDGGTGDTLTGVNNDIYKFSANAGAETINPSGNENVDTIEFDATVSAADVTLQAIGNDLVVTDAKAGVAITVKNEFFYNWGNHVHMSTIAFADGSSISLAGDQNVALTWDGSAGNMSLTGSNWGATNTFLVGAGDTISGANADTYKAGAGALGVTINPTSWENGDTIAFDGTVNEANVTMQAGGADGKNLIITDVADNVSITVKENFFYNWGNHSHVNAITFADGTSWSLAGDNNLTFNYDGSAGHMTLAGSSWAATNVFEGAAGDTLSGVNNDIYKFSANAGVETVNPSGNENSETIQFDGTISAADVTLQAIGNDLIVTDAKAGVAITVRNNFWYNKGNHSDVNTISFADGSSIALAGDQNVALTWDGSAGNMSLTGSSLGATNTFLLGAGDIISGANADTYKAGAGARGVTINPTDWENGDTVAFDGTVNEANVTMHAGGDGNDLIITDVADNVSITVKENFFYNWGNHSHVNAITFADGTSWSLAGDNNLTFNYDGSAGHMTLAGSSWAATNVFEGAAGDTLSGVNNDIYKFSANAGVETVNPSGNENSETIQFDGTISAADVTLQAVGNDLVLTDAKAGVAITVRNNFWYNKGNHSDVNTISFADGSSVSLAGDQNVMLTWNGSAGNMTLTGSSWGATNVFSGGAGDTLNGVNNDIYKFGANAGVETINPSGNENADTIQFDATISAADVTLQAVGNDLAVTDAKAGVAITLKNEFWYNWGNHVHMSTISFADGTSWSLAGDQNVTLTWNGSAGNMSLAGSSWGATNIFSGGAGDTISGVNTDVYKFSANAGVETINPSGNENADTIQFDGTVSAADVTLQAVGNDLVVTDAKAGVAITVKNNFWYNWGNHSHVNAISFGDGTSWSLAGDQNVTLTWNGSAGNMSLAGSSWGATNIFSGGAGDTISGVNTDIYKFGARAGVETINPSGNVNADTIEFDASVSAADVTLQAIGNDLVVTDAKAGVAITVKNNFWYNRGNYSHLNAITFADGTSWSLAGDNNLTFNYDGSAGNTALAGSGWAATNIFTGGAGDTISGVNTDVYKFSANAGVETINPGGNENADTIQFDGTVSAADVTLQAFGNDLVVADAKAGIAIRVKNEFFYNWGNHVHMSTISFADGTSWSLSGDGASTIPHPNHAPVVSAATGQITEQNGITGAGSIDSVSGSIAFTDADASDVHSAAIASVTATGVTAGLPSTATMLGWLSRGALTEPANGASGSVAWTFSAADSAFDYLGAGQTATLTYAVNVTDWAGATGVQNVTITVTGTNDAPVISAGTTAAGAIGEIANATSSSTLDTASGLITFTDADASNVHTVTFAGVTATGVTTGLPSTATMLGWLSKGTLSEPSSGAAGSIAWTFSAADSAFDYLGAGQTATLTYAVNITDPAGATAVQNVTIAITGTNDAPVIAAGTTATGAISEIANATSSSTLDTASGTISFTDPDASDVHSAAVASVTATGVTAGLPSTATMLGWLSKGIISEPAIGAAGSVAWTFSAADSAFDYLGAGQTATLTYAVNVTDAAGATALQNVTVTVTGSNDAPVITSGTTATGAIANTTGSSTADTAAGVIRFTDAEVSDVHSATIASVTATGVTAGLPSMATMLGWLSSGALTEPAKGTAGSIPWTFSAADSAFDYLGAGQTATLTYAVNITDSTGATTVQNVTITVTGSDDAPVIATGTTATGAISEIANATGSATRDTASGSIAFTDADASDVHTATIASVTATGVTAGLPSTATMLSWLSKGPVTEPANGTAGSIAWTFSAADSAFDYLGAGQTATLTYAVDITDPAGATAVQNVTITITGSNDAPIATAKSGFTTDNWTALTITGATLLAGCTDPDTSDTVTLTSVQGAVGGTVALTGGNAVFTPNGTSIGPESFTYTISDGHSASTTAAVSVTTTLHQINGTASADTLSGSSKGAQIDGLAGNDSITAGSAGDTIIGDSGSDTLTGGAGADTFVYHAGFGTDTINSFTATGTSHDTLQFDVTLFADWAHLLAATKQQGNDLVITLDASDTILLKKVSLSNFTAADARFV